MSEVTTYMQIPYPEENADPFWESYLAQMEATDQMIYMNKVKSNLILAGGGTVTWNYVTGILEWNADFVLPYFEFGYKLLVRYGPDAATRALSLQDGECLIIEIPYVMTTDVVKNFTVTNQLTPARYEQFVIAMRYGTKVFFRNGVTL